MAVTVSPGVATVAGTAGGGHAHASVSMRARLDAAACALTELNQDFPVETRVNSDGRTGGAWLMTVPGGGLWSNAEVGITVHDRDEQFTAYVKAVALREDSPLRPDLTGYTFDPARAGGTDRLYGAETVAHAGTLDEVLVFLTTHVRPAGAIAVTIAGHSTLVRAFRAVNAWWAVAHTGDDAHYVVLARRTVAVEWWQHEPSKDALERYAANTPLLRDGHGGAIAVDVNGLHRLLAVAHLAAADLEAGRVYKVSGGGLVATKFRSATVAVASHAVLVAASGTTGE